MALSISKGLMGGGGMSSGQEISHWLRPRLRLQLGGWRDQLERESAVNVGPSCATSKQPKEKGRVVSSLNSELEILGSKKLEELGVETLVFAFALYPWLP